MRALARSAAKIGLDDPNLKKLQGDALNPRDIETALDGMDVIKPMEGVNWTAAPETTPPKPRKA